MIIQPSAADGEAKTTEDEIPARIYPPRIMKSRQERKEIIDRYGIEGLTKWEFNNLRNTRPAFFQLIVLTVMANILPLTSLPHVAVHELTDSELRELLGDPEATENAISMMVSSCGFAERYDNSIVAVPSFSRVIEEVATEDERHRYTDIGSSAREYAYICGK